MPNSELWSLLEVIKKAIEVVVKATAYPLKMLLSMVGIAAPDSILSMIMLSTGLIIGLSLLTIHRRPRYEWYSMQFYNRGWRQICGSDSYIHSNRVYDYGKPGHYRLNARKGDGRYNILWKRSVHQIVGRGSCDSKGRFS